ncbi:hypothetical protein A2U01_0092651, partial [Trifolium medium]|nr:hypothetical protein [Trifolium medium]
VENDSGGVEMRWWC